MLVGQRQSHLFLQLKADAAANGRGDLVTAVERQAAPLLIPEIAAVTDPDDVQRSKVSLRDDQSPARFEVVRLMGVESKIQITIRFDVARSAAEERAVQPGRADESTIAVQAWIARREHTVARIHITRHPAAGVDGETRREAEAVDIPQCQSFEAIALNFCGN